MGARFAGAAHLGHRAGARRNGEFDVTIRDDLTVANEHNREPVGGNGVSSKEWRLDQRCVHSSNMKSTFNSVCITEAIFFKKGGARFQ